MRCSSLLCRLVVDRVSLRWALAGVFALAAFFALLPAGSASAWTPRSCSPDPADIELWSGIHCIGHREIRSRGRIAHHCLAADLPPATIYPSRTFCGGV